MRLPSWHGGGVAGCEGKDEDADEEEKGGGKSSRAGFGSLGGLDLDDDAWAEDELARTRVKRSLLTPVSCASTT